ncbi:MAG: V-type ATP synthase subunit I [Spirochaetaceae bacterium]|jgi:V/A-type H+-transporting ATPase subunit I|nr:V-type ATP synthase subunit I [Spirochaetaceae bacterium]
MIRPQKMKHLEMTVHTRDVDSVIEYLGRRGLMHFSGDTLTGGSGGTGTGPVSLIQEKLNRLRASARYLGINLPGESGEDTTLPQAADDRLTDTLASAILGLSAKEKEQQEEKKKLTETLTEARAFSKLNAPFSELEQLSYLTLRVGRLDPRRREELREDLADRAVIISLDDTGRILAAASRKGRFALDSVLKKSSFTPIEIPKEYTGIPEGLLDSLAEQIAGIEKELADVAQTKRAFEEEYGPSLKKLTESYLMALTVEELKGQLRGTENVFVIKGWVPAEDVTALVEELDRRTEGRIAIRAYNPEEVEDINEGRKKVPVSLKHGTFVRGFESIVFSYGAPLYGTLDPTLFVAFFFTLLFGIMFGDAGQGLVLFLAGFAAGRTNTIFESYGKFAVPLKAVGISSMIMGLLNGVFFTNEEILVKPTQAVLGFFMDLAGMAGEPPERILHLMPEKGNMAKLFYFFGFTVAVGVFLNSVGIIVNIVNQWSLKKYKNAFFAKTGLAGLFLFWYAIFIAVRLILGRSLFWYDSLGILIPGTLLFFGPAIWRLISGERPVLEHGFMVFIIEGFVEILETTSTYISNTVSFLRVGAFALSHAVLSLVVFILSEKVMEFPLGSAFSLFIVILGNAVIILLEGLIVTIQIIRLQYYEFFSKFFTETGVAFAPFRFTKKGV